MVKVLIIQDDLAFGYNKNNKEDVMDYANDELENNGIVPENIIDIKVNTVFVPMENCDIDDIRYVITVFYKVEE